MNTMMENDIKRWTTKPNPALVIEIIQGRTTVPEACRSMRTSASGPATCQPNYLRLDWVLQPQATSPRPKDEDPNPNLRNAQTISMTCAETAGALQRFTTLEKFHASLKRAPIRI